MKNNTVSTGKQIRKIYHRFADVDSLQHIRVYNRWPLYELKISEYDSFPGKVWYELTSYRNEARNITWIIPTESLYKIDLTTSAENLDEQLDHLDILYGEHLDQDLYKESQLHQSFVDEPTYRDYLFNI